MEHNKSTGIKYTADRLYKRRNADWSLIVNGKWMNAVGAVSRKFDIPLPTLYAQNMPGVMMMMMMVVVVVVMA